MKLDELRSYLNKKIGKPIFCHLDQLDIGARFSANLTYIVEPVAISDENALHALVSLKSRTIRMGTVKLAKEPVANHEVKIPLNDGDSMTLVLMMSVAEAVGRRLLLLSRENAMRKLFECLQDRLTDIELNRIGLGGP